MPKGKVKWFNDQSDGFKTLAEGQEVEFEVVESEKGPKAVKVVKL